MSYTPTSYYGHSVKDRTSEFHGLVESIASRSAQPTKQKLLNTSGPGSSPKGEFARRAQAISKDIASTTAKLQRLAQCMFYPSSLLSFSSVTIMLCYKIDGRLLNNLLLHHLLCFDLMHSGPSKDAV